ncbi:MAG TPA: hypothetical protein VGA75_01640 [Paracoccaceae bacterium]
MKRIFIGIVFSCLAGTAIAGGIAEPVMEPAVVEAETASSGGDNWVGLLMLALIAGTVLTQ